MVQPRHLYHQLMCTVTYLPHPSGDYSLTSNRDEQPARAPRRITRVGGGASERLFPQDTRAGGTWIATAGDNRTACLLNGAFEAHRRRPPYRRSRGLMVLDFFDYPDGAAFATGYDFEGIEPFTMILLERGRLRELRWDEHWLHERTLNPAEPHLWSSATLYDAAARRKRAQWFQQCREAHREFGLAEILDFHQHAGAHDPWNGIVMNRGARVRTVSITSVIRSGTEVRMRYEDLLSRQVTQAKIQLNGEVVECS